MLKAFIKYAAQSTLGMLAISCYILADTFFVSLAMGSDGLAALNIALPAYAFINGTGLMLGMGGSIRSTVLRSRGENASADAVFTNTVYLAAAFSVLFVLAGLFFSRPLVTALGADGAIYPLAEIYLRIMLLFAPAFISNDVLLCYTRNDGNPRLAMVAQISGSAANILLDYVFMFPLGMGMTGAILATGGSPLIGITLMLVRVVRGKSGFRPVRVPPDIRTIGRHFTLGVPSLVEQFSSGVVMIVFNNIILAAAGDKGVAAYGVVANISMIAVYMFAGIAQGTQPLMSRAYGEGRRRDLTALLRYALTAAVGLGAVVYAALLSLAPQVAGIFNSEGDAAMQAMAETGIRLYFAALPFVAFNVVTCAFFSARERALPAQAISVARGLVIIVPMALLLSFVWGMTGVWLAYPTTEALVAAGTLVLLVRECGRVASAEEKIS